MEDVNQERILLALERNRRARVIDIIPSAACRERRARGSSLSITVYKQHVVEPIKICFKKP